jgi:hypothetical protein
MAGRPAKAAGRGEALRGPANCVVRHVQPGVGGGVNGTGNGVPGNGDIARKAHPVNP